MRGDARAYQHQLGKVVYIELVTAGEKSLVRDPKNYASQAKPSNWKRLGGSYLSRHLFSPSLLFSNTNEKCSALKKVLLLLVRRQIAID